MIENLFLSVGAMKAGTTWLYAQLMDHPDIFFSREKEIHYFAHLHSKDMPLSREARLTRFKDFGKAINEKGNLDLVRRLALWYGNYLNEPINDLWYANLFCYRGRQKYCADFSNLYALLPDEGWSHVRRVGRNLRVIYTMRDPLRRLWSHTRFHLYVIGQFDNLSRWSRGEYKAFLESPHVEAHTHYTDIVSRLRRNLSADELRVYFFESFRNRPADMLRDVETFLDVGNKAFNPEALDRKVASVPDLEMPKLFAELCASVIARECEGLTKLGLQVPPEWAVA